MNAITRPTLSVLFALLLAGSAALAQSALSPLSRNTPQLAAIATWHLALAKNDFSTYKKVAKIPDEPDPTRNDFEALRKWTPETIKVTDLSPLPNGNFNLHVVGCKDSRRQVAMLIVVKAGTEWRVFAAGWAQVWGPDAKACPL